MTVSLFRFYVDLRSSADNKADSALLRHVAAAKSTTETRFSPEQGRQRR
jgi:hypothetical protein